MRKWSRNSSRRLSTCTENVQWLMTVIRDEVADISILDGYRGAYRQNKAFREGNSKVQYPNGKHNRKPSQAVDICPHPRPKDERKLWAALGYIAGRAAEIGKRRGLTVRWGGDWDGDGDLTDQSFDDLFHIEVTED